MSNHLRRSVLPLDQHQIARGHHNSREFSKMLAQPLVGNIIQSQFLGGTRFVNHRYFGFLDRMIRRILGLEMAFDTKAPLTETDQLCILTGEIATPQA